MLTAAGLVVFLSGVFSAGRRKQQRPAPRARPAARLSRPVPRHAAPGRGTGWQQDTLDVDPRGDA